MPLVEAEDDLTGKPGRFRFVTCSACGLAYQNPRLKAEHIAAYYDDEYIAHRKKTDWGLLTPLYEWAMGKHDRDKLALVSRFVELGPGRHVLDVGCGAGTFLAHAQAQTGASPAGVDFKDLSHLPWMQSIEFHHGQLLGAGLPRPPLRSGHDVAFPRARLRAAAHAGLRARPARRARPDGDRGAAARQPDLSPVPRTLARLQAPQHMALFSRATLLRAVEQAGLRVVDYLPYGAFPPYFYLFTGAAFKLLKGRGLNLSQGHLPVLHRAGCCSRRCSSSSADSTSRCRRWSAKRQ